MICLNKTRLNPISMILNIPLECCKIENSGLVVTGRSAKRGRVASKTMSFHCWMFVLTSQCELRVTDRAKSESMGKGVLCMWMH